MTDRKVDDNITLHTAYGREFALYNDISHYPETMLHSY